MEDNAYQRFEELLLDKGVTAYKVSKATGITTTTLTNWKKGKYVPKADKLQLIDDYFGVTLDYLMTGKESNIESFSTQADLLINIRNDKEMMEALKKYYSLSDRKKKHVLDLIDLLAEVAE